jgi:hypothetical protein
MFVSFGFREGGFFFYIIFQASFKLIQLLRGIVTNNFEPENIRAKARIRAELSL